MLRTDKEKLMSFFQEKCKRHSLSITPQRVAIYEELIKSKNHPNSEDIFEKVKNLFPNIALDTVYRTLSTFAEIGVANVVEGYGEAKRYDPDTTAHHHFRCRRCNKILDFHNRRYDNLPVPKSFRRGFDVMNIKVVLEGLCDKCMK